MAEVTKSILLDERIWKFNFDKESSLHTIINAIKIILLFRKISERCLLNYLARSHQIHKNNSFLFNHRRKYLNEKVMKRMLFLLHQYIWCYDTVYRPIGDLEFNVGSVPLFTRAEYLGGCPMSSENWQLVIVNFRLYWSIRIRSIFDVFLIFQFTHIWNIQWTYHFRDACNLLFTKGVQQYCRKSAYSLIQIQNFSRLYLDNILMKCSLNYEFYFYILHIDYLKKM